MKCSEFIEALGDLVAAQMPDSDRARMHEHCDECEPCVEFLRSYNETIALEKCCFEDDEPGPEDAAVVDEILSRRPKKD